ncbi:hypothetical protein ACHAXR_009773 [Thalassiosira sp. AJA248-18]
MPCFALSSQWKTSAGRVDGVDGFVAGDAWRLLKIHFKSTSKPSVCPVCLERPSSEENWYITKSCKHAMCRDCLQNYALSLISDPNHSGPLKCPCCPRLLRVEDAQVALNKQLHGTSSESVTLSRKVIPKVKRNRQEKGGLFADADDDGVSSSALEVLEKWDKKTTDQLLRSMRDFRPCPHCSDGPTLQDHGISDNGSMEKTISNKGGGFVTPDCLAPINQERESNAESLLKMAGAPSSKFVLLSYVIYYLYCGSRESSNPVLQVMSAIIPSVLLPILPHALRLYLATIAKREVMRPIIVACPCCFKDFNLDASSELQLPDSSSDTAAEAATQRWKHSNTRPCPGCSSPIMKDGGCNHVKCSNCRVHFCWGCMRTRSGCRAYNCKNGAPFGNAFGDGSLGAVREGLNALERERQGQTMVERIDYVESEALRQLTLFRTFPFRFAALIGFIFIASFSIVIPGRVVGIVIRGTLALAETILHSSMRIFCVVVLYSVGSLCMHRLRRIANTGATNGHGADGARRWQQQNVARGFNRRTNGMVQRRRSLSFRRRPRFRTEQEQLAEAIARSLAEQ